MVIINIRNVPAELHTKLSRQAKPRGLSLSRYVRESLEEVAGLNHTAGSMDKTAEARKHRHDVAGRNI